MLKSRRARGLLVALLLVAPHLLRAQAGGQFLYPISVTVDRSGNVLVSENQRNRISIFGPNGELGWHQGSQGNADGQFNIPAGIATDSLGFVYAADYGNSRVQKFNAATGAFVTKWGSAGSGQGQFRKPIAIAVDAQNNVSVLDNQTLKVQKFSNDGTTFLGSWGGQSGTGDGQFATTAGGPFDLVMDGAGFAYVSDPGNQRIQRWQIVSNSTTGVIQTATFVGWLGRCTSGSGCDVVNQRSIGFTCTAATCSAPSQGSSAGQFINPEGLALDASGHLFVADSINNRVQEFSAAGAFMRQFGSQGMLPGEFRTPIDVAVSPLGDVYVADSRNERIAKFSSSGVFELVFGGSIALSASLGFPPRPIDALVDPNPLFVFPGGTGTSTVLVTSLSGFQGSIDLATTGCCLDLATSAFMPNALATSLFPASVQVPLSGGVSSTLTITAAPTATPEKLAIPLFAGNAQLYVSTATGVAAEILPPVPADTGKVSPCIGSTVVGSIGGTTAGFGPEVLPLSAVTTGLYTVKAATPAKTSFQIGAASTTMLAEWTITVSKASRTLAPNQAVVVLRNSTSWGKGMTTVNSANCAAAGQFTQLNMGESSTFVISRADTSTVLLTRQVCRTRFIWCWDTSEWDAFAVFDEGPFWSLFGGRQVSIDWFFSQGE